MKRRKGVRNNLLLKVAKEKGEISHLHQQKR